MSGLQFDLGRHLIEQDSGRHPVFKSILAANSKFLLGLFSRSPDQQNKLPITIAKRCSSMAEELALVLSTMVRKKEVEVKEEKVMEAM